MKSRSSPIAVFLLLFMFCTDIGAQQQDQIDSLNRLLRKFPLRDTSRFKLYGELSWLYATTRSETIEARKYADSIYYLAVAIKNPKGEALSHFYYGAIDRFEGNFSDGLKHLNAFIQFCVSQGDSSRVALALFQVGTIYLTIDEQEKGLTALYRALAIHEEESDQSSTNFVPNAIGTVLKNSGRYNEAIATYQRVLTTDSLNSDVLMNLGNVYAVTREFDQALRLYRKALHIDQAAEMDWAVAYDMAAIGELFNTLQRHDSALIYHQQALSIREDLQDKQERLVIITRNSCVDTSACY